MNLKHVCLIATLAISSVASAQVTFYRDDNFRNTACPVAELQSIPRLDRLKFGDQADSAKWNIRRGICLVLYESDNYQQPRLILFGRGSLPDMDSIKFGDELDSVQWSGDAILTDPRWQHVPRLGTR